MVEREPIGRDQSSSQWGRRALGYDPIASRRGLVLRPRLEKSAAARRVRHAPAHPLSRIEHGLELKRNRTRVGPQSGICQPRSLADRTPISDLWVDAGKVQVGDDPFRTIIGVNIVHGHFDTRSLPAAGGLLRQIALVNNL
jgi:hypothetical protein